MRHLLVLLVWSACVRHAHLDSRSHERSGESAESDENSMSHETTDLPEVPERVTCRYATHKILEYLRHADWTRDIGRSSHDLGRASLLVIGYNVTDFQDLHQIMCELWGSRSLAALDAGVTRLGADRALLRFGFNTFTNTAQLSARRKYPAHAREFGRASRAVRRTLLELGLLRMDLGHMTRVRALVFPLARPLPASTPAVPPTAPTPAAPPCGHRLQAALYHWVTAWAHAHRDFIQHADTIRHYTGIDVSDLAEYRETLCQIEGCGDVGCVVAALGSLPARSRALRVLYEGAVTALTSAGYRARLLLQLTTPSATQRAHAQRTWRVYDALQRGGLLSIQNSVL